LNPQRAVIAGLRMRNEGGVIAIEFDQHPREARRPPIPRGSAKPTSSLDRRMLQAVAAAQPHDAPRAGARAVRLRPAETMSASYPPRGVTRRSLLVAAVPASLASPAVAAPFVVDGAGRRVTVPRSVERVFPAGPPAAIQLYTLAPQTLIGWPRANRPDEQQFLLPGVGNRPEIGRIAGRGGSANLEAVIASRPDLIVDAGSVRATFVEMADRVQAQTGIPYALLDGRFDAIPASYEAFGALVGREQRARELAQQAEDIMRTVVARVARVPMAERPRVYYARGPAGLETGLRGSINVEILEFMGVRNVAAELEGGLTTVSIEQVLRWDPQVIVTIDLAFAAAVRDSPLWQGVRAVRDGRVHLSPKLPFGWLDFPPGVNRLIGLWWLGKVIFPSLFPEDLKALTREFYRRWYHVDIDSGQVERVFAGRG
jgi:iron complex transport system substrate-binding protein